VLPPGPREPAALQTAEWVLRPYAFLRRMRARHGDVFTLRLAFDAPMVVLADPGACREVWALPADVAARAGAAGPLAPVVGPRSITALDGEPHLRARRLLLAPFHGEALAALRAPLAELAERHVAALPAGRPVALLPRFAELTLEAILRVVVGRPDPALAAHTRAALGHVRALPYALLLALTPPGGAAWRPFLRHVRAAEARIAELVRDRPAGVLAHLLDAGCDAGEVRDHVLTLVAAGHDTTAAALAWCAERLARGGEVTATSPPMGFVREVLVRRPPLTVAPRHLVQPARVAGHELPAGVHVAPSAFLAGAPFGGGARRCTGAAFAEAELAAVVQALAERWVVRPQPGHEAPERPRRRGVAVTPDRGATVVLEAR
jgi:cytochrome P450 family 135